MVALLATAASLIKDKSAKEEIVDMQAQTEEL